MDGAERASVSPSELVPVCGWGEGLEHKLLHSALLVWGNRGLKQDPQGWARPPLQRL